ncbi:MAG: hypothetical protein A2381_18730 [Bdellovibrionales bacterium RIFOXYB1_FULL_37_110]|nr:MAG: hypothetical protein A2417_18280 [Bdellovibrionales bacterium RIFOXYC1_FULL_37_79]OFZ58323.1 MAG: hypothetical protein A2381_18730 [Bdellovibrionales bacterium RIFOXYB1_FULL_37_110]OFZ63808.1 MAG: hypothetical protein A2577_12740 [Bdellovibrionales bacterium RIFOXYD1_FULL_36_51]
MSRFCYSIVVLFFCFTIYGSDVNCGTYILQGKVEFTSQNDITLILNQDTLSQTKIYFDKDAKSLKLLYFNKYLTEVTVDIYKNSKKITGKLIRLNKLIPLINMSVQEIKKNTCKK